MTTVVVLFFANFISIKDDIIISKYLLRIYVEVQDLCVTWIHSNPLEPSGSFSAASNNAILSKVQ